MSEGLVCASCGAAIPGDSDFCPVCGSPVTQPDDGAKAAVGPVASEGPSVPQGVPAETGTRDVAKVTPEKSRAPEAPKDEARVSLPTSPSVRPGAWPELVELVAGIIITLAGLALAFSVDGDLESISFGGDAYTYIYQGLVVISQTLVLLARCLGAAIAAFGAVMASRAAARLTGSRKG